MPMPMEMIVVRIFKSSVVCGAGVLMAFLLKFSYQIECPVVAYPAGVLWAVLLSVGILFFYTHFDLFSSGLLSVRVGAVRAILAGVLLVELVWMVVLSIHKSGCEGFLKVAVLPFGLVVFYSIFVLMMLFGDAFFGVMRKVIRLGVDPRRFS